MNIGVAFAIFIVAMAVTHLVVRISRRVSKRLPHKALQAQAGSSEHVDWYCFFRPQKFSCGKNPSCSVRQPKKARPRPRAMVVR